MQPIWMRNRKQIIRSFIFSFIFIFSKNSCWKISINKKKAVTGWWSVQWWCLHTGPINERPISAGRKNSMKKKTKFGESTGKMPFPLYKKTIFEYAENILCMLLRGVQFEILRKSIWFFVSNSYLRSFNATNE